MTTFIAQRDHQYQGYNELSVMCCPTCFVLYAIPERWRADAQQKGNREIVWYCPAGHEVGYNGPSSSAAAEKRAKQAEERARWAEQRLQAERDLREDTERRLSAQKGATTRAKRRHAAGVCPCCHRSFKQLREHMATRHPGYDPANGAPPKTEKKEPTRGTAPLAASGDLIVKRWAEGRTMKEIAAEIGTTVNSLGTQMHRLREAGHDLPKRPPGGLRQ